MMAAKSAILLVLAGSVSAGLVTKSIDKVDEDLETLRLMREHGQGFEAYNESAPVLIQGEPCLCRPSPLKGAICEKIRKTWVAYDELHNAETKTPESFYSAEHCPEIDDTFAPIAKAYEAYNKKAGWKKVGPWKTAKVTRKEWMHTNPADWVPFEIWGYYLDSGTPKSPVLIIVPGLNEPSNFLEMELLIASMLRIMKYSVLVMAKVEGGLKPHSYIARVNAIAGTIQFVAKGQLDGKTRRANQLGMISMSWGSPRAATVYGQMRTMPGLWLDGPIFDYKAWFKHNANNEGTKIPAPILDKAADEFMRCSLNHYTGDLGEGGVADGLHGRGGYGRNVLLVSHRDDPKAAFDETTRNAELLTSQEYFVKTMEYRLPEKVLANPSCVKHQIAPGVFPVQYRWYLCTYWGRIFRGWSSEEAGTNCGKRVDGGSAVAELADFGTPPDILTVKPGPPIW